MMKKRLLLKNIKARVQKPYPIYDQNGRNQLFMTKTAEKPIPFGAAPKGIAHIREYPPPRAQRKRECFIKWLVLQMPLALRINPLSELVVGILKVQSRFL